jgi:hypothetical protein
MSRRQRFTTALAVLSLAAPLASVLLAQSTVAQDSVTQIVAAPVAQAPTPAPVTLTTAPAERTTPLATVTPAGVTQSRIAASTRTTATTPFALRSSEGGHNPAMMVVGGAAMIVGAVVGGTAGTIVMIGGGILGLVGLWNYMQ